MRKYYLLLLSIFSAFSLHAQSNRITGKVYDVNSNKPIQGVRVEQVGKGAALTNDKGEFNMECSGTTKITFSLEGYKTITKEATCGQDITIILNPSILNIDEVEVTATSNPNRSQLEQPVSLVTLKPIEIDRSTGLFLQDAINTNVPGVFMGSRTIGGGQQINIRGYGNGLGFKGISSNFDSQGLKLYLNGIPITDAEGITVLDDIDYGSVSNLEILKGPSGTLYGLAIAGVVNLQMQKADKNKISISEQLMAGSYGLFRTTTKISVGGENSSVLVNYGHQKYDGFMPHTASTKDFANVLGDFTLNKKQSLFTYLGYTNSYDERNGEATLLQYDTFDYSGNPRYIKNNAHSAVKTFRAGISHTYKFNDKFSNTSSVFGSGQNIDQSSAGGWTDKNPINYGFRSVLENKFQLSDVTSLSGITGIEMQRMNYLNTSYGMGADSTNLIGYNIITSLKSNQYIQSSASSYFTQWTLTLPRQFSLTAGVGISSMALHLEDRLWSISGNNHPGNSKSQVFEAKYNNLVSPNIAINKKLGTSNSVYINYSTGYKAPVGSNVLISYTGQVNADLKPEKGTQIELGTKGSMLGNRLFYTVALFNAKFENKFTVIAVPDPTKTTTLYSYVVNGGEMNNNGLELLVRYNVIKKDDGFFKMLQPFANLTYSDFHYGDFSYNSIGKDIHKKDSLITYDYTGNQVAGVSPVVVNAGVDVETRIGLYGNITYNYRSALYITSDLVNEANAYSLLNAKLGFKKFVRHFDFDLFAGAINITNEQYYAMVFVNQLADAYIPAYNKINFFGGLNLKYNF